MIKYLLISHYLLKDLKEFRRIGTVVLIPLIVILYFFVEYKILGSIHTGERILLFAFGYEVATIDMVMLLIFAYLLVNVGYLVSTLFYKGDVIKSEPTPESAVIPKPEREIKKTKVDEGLVAVESNSGFTAVNGVNYSADNISVIFEQSLFETSAQSNTAKPSKFDRTSERDAITSNFLNKIK